MIYQCKYCQQHLYIDFADDAAPYCFVCDKLLAPHEIELAPGSPKYRAYLYSLLDESEEL